MFCFRVNAPIESYLIKYIPHAFWIMPGLNRKKLRQYQMFMLILFFFIHWNLEKKAFLKRFSFSEKKNPFCLFTFQQTGLCLHLECTSCAGWESANVPAAQYVKTRPLWSDLSEIISESWLPMLSFEFLHFCRGVFFSFFFFFLSSILWKGINCNEQEDIVFIFFLQGKWSESYNHRNKVSECFAC